MIKLFVTILACFSLSCQISATEFNVSLNGNDAWSGRLATANEQQTDGPFRTLGKARDAIRKLKTVNRHTSEVTVNINKGIYVLENPFSFDSQDSGGLGENITWQGVGNKNDVIISGGKEITTCKQSTPPFWECDVRSLNLNEVEEIKHYRIKGNAPNFELFVNEKRMQLARWPNQGWAYIKQPVNERRKFTFFHQKGLKSKSFKNAQVYIWPGNDWFDQYVGISLFDQKNNKITLSDDVTYPLISGRRFIIRNIESDLDSPWEWFYDSANHRIRFLLPEGYNPKTVIVSFHKHVVNIDNAKNLVFSNITLKHSTGTGIQIDNSSDIQFKNMNISNVGGFGIEGKRCERIFIYQSVVHHTGLGGVSLIGGDRESLKRSDNLISNTHIHHTGEVLANYVPAVNFKGVGATLRHSLIEYSPGQGIEIGGNEHLIEKNELHHLCTEADDCGAIYSGRDWTHRGNVIRYNSIHDMYGYGLDHVDIKKGTVVYKRKGGRGVYLDDGMSGYDVIGNIFNNAGTISVQIGGGRDNHIANNVFLTNDYALWIDNRWPEYKWEINRERLDKSPYKNSIWQKKYPALAKPMRNDTWPEGNLIERNIIVSTNPSIPQLRFYVPSDNNRISNNVVWNTKGNVKVDYDVLDRQNKKSGANWPEWLAEGIEIGSLEIDPCLIVHKNQINSCIQGVLDMIGFKPLPLDIGLYDTNLTD